MRNYLEHVQQPCFVLESLCTFAAVSDHMNEPSGSSLLVSSSEVRRLSECHRCADSRLLFQDDDDVDMLEKKDIF